MTPNDDDPVGAVSTGVLLGEKEEEMIELKILKQECQQVEISHLCEAVKCVMRWSLSVMPVVSIGCCFMGFICT